MNKTGVAIFILLLCVVPLFLLDDKDPVTPVVVSPKFAIFLTGVLRCFPKISEKLIKHVLEPNGWPDLYIFLLYDKTNAIDLHSIRVLSSLPNIQVFLYNELKDEKYWQQVKNISGYPFRNKMPEITVDHVLSCWYGYKRIREAFLYLNKTYKMIGRFRIDVEFEELLNMTNFVGKGTLFVPEGNDYRNGLNDQLAIGNQDEIIKYLDIRSGLPDLYHIQKMPFHPETMLKAWLGDMFIVRPQINYKINRNC